MPPTARTGPGSGPEPDLSTPATNPAIWPPSTPDGGHIAGFVAEGRRASGRVVRLCCRLVSHTTLHAAPASVIRARGLRKQYGEFHAVKGIDLDVRPGECFGLLGPNGAGKSTTMRMLAGTSQRTAGELTILGIDPEEDGPAVRARLGVVPQQDNLDEELTARENILIYGRYFGLPYSYLRPKAEELLAFAQLTEKADAKVTDLSGGMKRRLVIARALVNEPALFLLDEPTTGLDPQARHILWDRLYRLKERGTTLLLTTHHMDEAEQLCDRLVVVDGGEIMAAGTPAELIREHASREVLEARFGADRNEAAARTVQAHAGDGVVHRVEVLPDRVLVYARRADDLHDVVQRLVDEGALPAPATTLTRRASLEDVFLILTGRTLVD